MGIALTDPPTITGADEREYGNQDDQNCSHHAHEKRRVTSCFLSATDQAVPLGSPMDEPSCGCMRLTCERAYTCTVPYDMAFFGFIFAPGHSGCGARPCSTNGTYRIACSLRFNVRPAGACRGMYYSVQYFFWKKLASDRKQAYKRCAARIDPLGADD